MISKPFDRRQFALLGGAALIAGQARAVSVKSHRLAKPTVRQLAFQDMEVGAFIHYSIDTYGSLHGQMPASGFNPADLDAEQWVLAAKAMGAGYVVLTARHEQGFCLWPTATTDYSIRNSPYKDGKGDVVREFVDACRKHGIKPGLYTPPWIDDNWDTRHGVDISKGNAGIDKYDDPALFAKVRVKEMAQQHELLTGYGPLVFYWDDHYGRSDSIGPTPQGGVLRKLYADLGKRSHQLQPGMLYFGPDVEHVGNEDGHTCYPMWNAIDTLDGTQHSIGTTFKWEGDNMGVPRGHVYRPRLGSTTNGLSTGGWMWTGPRTVQPLEERMRVYYDMVGRGAGVIINLTPDPSGRIPDNLVAGAKEIGDEIARRFSTPVREVKATGPVATLRFDAARRIDHLVAMENLIDGQKIAGYVIEAEIDGKWKSLVQGQTVGHKRIDRISPVTTAAVRFVCMEALETPVSLRSFAAYDTEALG